LDWGIPKIRVPSTPPTVGPLFQEHPLDWGIPKIRVSSTPPTVGPLFQEHPSDRGIPKRRALGFTASGPLSWE